MIARLRLIHRMLIAAALTASIAAPLWAQEKDTVAIGPYVQNVSANLATVCWATASGQVNYAPSGDEPPIVRELDFHSVLLRDLEPGTTYTYDILRDGSDAGKGTFTTFPKGEQPFTFVVLGDTRPNEHYEGLLKRIITENPTMVFNTGDLVSDGRDIRQWEAWFQIGRDLMRNVPCYPVLGNHENDSHFYFDLFALPGNERYYSFNRGLAHFVALDTPGQEIPETNQAITKDQEARFHQEQEQYWQRQMDWLKEDLAGHKDSKYIFVFFHYPPYSVKASRVEGARAVRQRFGSVFQDNNVSVVFTGHDHHYHRAVAGGVQFVTTGGGGAGLYDTDAPQPESVKYTKVHHYVRVDVGPDKAAIRATDIDGNLIEEFEVRPRAAAR